MFLDPLYLILLAPGMLLAAWAQWRIHAAYQDGLRHPARSGLTGAEAAAAVLRAAGVTGVGIEAVGGLLTDHYDPGAKVLRLSREVYLGRSLAALGIAAHEVGHAVQDRARYPLLVVRNALVPLASIGSNLSWFLILLGLVLVALRSAWGQPVVLLGVGAFSLTVLFQLVNLPVEFDASRRARALLLEDGLVRIEEDAVVKRVLDAAALTYVAATLTAVLTLVYFLIRAGLLGGGREE